MSAAAVLSSSRHVCELPKTVCVCDRVSKELENVKEFDALLKEAIEALVKYLSQTETGTIDVIVKTLAGNNKPVKLPLVATVGDLKDALSDVAPAGQLRLIYRGKEMSNNGDFLRLFDLDKGATIHAVLRLRGGMYHPSSSHSDFEKLTCRTQLENIREVFRTTNKQIKRIKSFLSEKDSRKRPLEEGEENKEEEIASKRARGNDSDDE